MAGMVTRSISRARRAWEGARELAGIAVIIPAWQPRAELLELVTALRDGGISRIIVVDDGSTLDCSRVFNSLSSLDRVTVCRHETNQGKGRALKTAFQLVLETMPAVRGVVTADADGQHLPADVVHVAQQLALVPDRPILGVRGFSGRVPLRSRLGNALTRQLFRVLTGHRVKDTQTGLRGLPMAILPALLALPGERYEYEMVMLAHLAEASGPPDEVEIATVYLESNRSSHFHPLRDSLRVYAALVRACCMNPRDNARRIRKTKPHLRPV